MSVTKSIASFAITLPVCGRAKTPTVIAANGTAITFMNGILRPPLKLLPSDQPAINGSVTASKIRPTAVMMPNRVSPKNSGWVLMFDEKAAFSPV